MNSRVLLQNNMPLVYRLKHDMYWYKVLELCKVSEEMIRVYESKKSLLSQTDWFEFIRLFENLGGKLDRVIAKHGVFVDLRDGGMDEVEKMRVKISVLLRVANTKIE